MAVESPHLRKLISASFAGWQQKIAAVVQEAVEQKELPVDTEPEPLAGFLLNSWEGALLRSQVEKSDAPLEIFLRYALDALTQKPKPRTHREQH
jgi:TetR/AcrR family transcriptional repressor of nem operon